MYISMYVISLFNCMYLVQGAWTLYSYISMVDLLPIYMCLLMYTNVYFDSHKNLRKTCFDV